jgi:hypothetical protein
MATVKWPLHKYVVMFLTLFLLLPLRTYLGTLWEHQNSKLLEINLKIMHSNKTELALA